MSLFLVLIFSGLQNFEACNFCRLDQFINMWDRAVFAGSTEALLKLVTWLRGKFLGLVGVCVFRQI